MDEFYGKKSSPHDRFAHNEETGVFKLRADGCAKRFDSINPYRDNELMPEGLSKRREFSTRWNNAESNENMTLNCLAILKSKGIVDIQPDEDTEQFIIRHADVLENVAC